MKKNVSSQKVGCQMCSATDGSAFTGSVTVYVTGDAGTQAIGSVGSGACTHEGNGYHTYAPSQAETNYDLVAFTFIGTGAIPTTVQLYTIPTTGLLAPTVADRTLDVSSGGEAGIDWANVGSPTTTLNLSGTTVKTATDVETDTADIQSRIPAALVSGRIDSSVGAMASGVLTATAIAADAITDAKVASDVTIASVTGAVGSVTGAVGSVTGNVGGSVASVVGNVGGSVASVVGAVGSVTGNVGGSVGSVTGNVGGSVGSVATGGISAASFAAGAITSTVIATGAVDADALATDAVTEIAAGILGATIEGSYDLSECIKVIAAGMGGKTSISGSTVTFRNLSDSKDVIVATVVTNERTAVTLDVT